MLKIVMSTAALFIVLLPCALCFLVIPSLLGGNRGGVISTSHSPHPLSMSSQITNGVIVGGGRIGNFLWEANDKKDVLLSKREETIPDEGMGPIYLATRNNDLDAIIAKTPKTRRGDLVFLQNGILTNYLKSKGLSDNTQGLIYLAVSKKGEKPIDGITDLNPEGLTAITGKWADDFALRLKKAGLSCHVLDKPTWTAAMLEKHIWICAFMAVGAQHKCTVGEVEKDHNEEVRKLIRELGDAATKETGVQFKDGFSDRLCAYARSVAHFPTALKEFEWRNGWFVDISLTAISKLQPDPCPMHTQIMSDHKLLFKARKEWVKRKQQELEYLDLKDGIRRELLAEMEEELAKEKETELALMTAESQEIENEKEKEKKIKPNSPTVARTNQR
jgi:hypothetical protein